MCYALNNKWQGVAPGLLHRQVTCVKNTGHWGPICHFQYGGDVSSHGCKMVASIQYHIPLWQLTKQGRREDRRDFFCCNCLFSGMKYFLGSCSKCVFISHQPEVGPNPSLNRSWATGSAGEIQMSLDSSPKGVYSDIQTDEFAISK